ncbi:MarR family winged helix-turn-helix transcriptional regulator [Marinibaculum pumilum]|uniref:MarR family winged helix-turn-helix transcriptional regulator n=1 Tax=Marinibaculum pumilum TaxID=1766165 RepID=A0ABV7L5F3_9PROT
MTDRASGSDPDGRAATRRPAGGDSPWGTRPLERFGGDCICFNLRKATRIVTRSYENAVKPLGLKATQFSILAALMGRPPVPMARLAEVMGLERTSLTRNLRPLESHGWVRVESPAEDRRARRIAITEAGAEVVRQAVPLWRHAQDEAVARLQQEFGDDAWHDLRRRLQVLHDLPVAAD